MEPDPFADIHVFGLYGGESSPTGMLARMGGKVQRVSVDDNVGSWTLKRIEDRFAIFEKNGEERKLELLKAKPPPPPKQVIAAPGAPGAAAGGPATPSGGAEQRSQQLEEMIRQRQQTMRRR